MAREKRSVVGGSPRGRTRLLGAIAVVSALAFALLILFALRLRPPQTEAAARLRLARLKPRASELNVVFVTLDTLRADRLGCYGFQGISTPAIDGLARDGVLFEQATATVPLTFPAHASIFTGRIPPHHGVRDNGGFFLVCKRLERGSGAGSSYRTWIRRRWQSRSTHPVRDAARRDRLRASPPAVQMGARS